MVVKKPGQVVLFKFPQTNLVTGKLRPALFIKQIAGRYGDWLTCMVSSKTGQENIDLDDIIEITDGDFIQSGLTIERLMGCLLVRGFCLIMSRRCGLSGL
jgi:hypothetical protein